MNGERVKSVFVAAELLKCGRFYRLETSDSSDFSESDENALSALLMDLATGHHSDIVFLCSGFSCIQSVLFIYLLVQFLYLNALSLIVVVIAA